MSGPLAAARWVTSAVDGTERVAVCPRCEVRRDQWEWWQSSGGPYAVVLAVEDAGDVGRMRLGEFTGQGRKGRCPRCRLRFQL